MTEYCPICGELTPHNWVCLPCYRILAKWLLKHNICDAQAMDCEIWYKCRDKYLALYLAYQKIKVEFT